MSEVIYNFLIESSKWKECIQKGNMEKALKIVNSFNKNFDNN